MAKFNGPRVELVHCLFAPNFLGTRTFDSQTFESCRWLSVAVTIHRKKHFFFFSFFLSFFGKIVSSSQNSGGSPIVGV